MPLCLGHGHLLPTAGGIEGPCGKWYQLRLHLGGAELETESSEHLLPSCSRQEGLFPCFVWKGFPTFPAHLRMRPVSRVNLRHSVVGGVTGRNTPISRPTLEKNPMPGHLFEGNPVDEGTKRRVTDTPVHHSVKAAGSTHSSIRGLSSHEQLERQAEFHSCTQDEA